MNDYQRCTQCNGRKQIASLGFIEKDCSLCKGVGYLVHEQLTATKIIQTALDVIDETNSIPKKKRKKGISKPALQANHPLSKLKDKVMKATEL